MSAVGLSHGFGAESNLFAGLSFDLRAGDLAAVTGPSGSGKSTLLSILAGWVTPRDGHVRRDGVDSVGWVFQNPHGAAARTALDHVALPLMAKGWRRRDANREAALIMTRFGLGGLEGKRFGMLSGGEAQRLMLARATARRPGLLLVDEPTAQLDRAASATVNRVLASLADSNMIVVVATHDPATAAACPIRLELGGHG